MAAWLGHELHGIRQKPLPILHADDGYQWLPVAEKKSAAIDGNNAGADMDSVV